MSSTELWYVATASEARALGTVFDLRCEAGESVLTAWRAAPHDWSTDEVLCRIRVSMPTEEDDRLLPVRLDRCLERRSVSSADIAALEEMLQPYERSRDDAYLSAALVGERMLSRSATAPELTYQREKQRVLRLLARRHEAATVTFVTLRRLCEREWYALLPPFREEEL